MQEIKCPKCGWSYHVELGVVQDQKQDKFVPTECPKCGYRLAGRLKDEQDTEE